MRSARSVVNTAPPEDFAHFHYNAKRCMVQAERLFDIERVRVLLHTEHDVVDFSMAGSLENADLDALLRDTGPSVACILVTAAWHGTACVGE